MRRSRTQRSYDYAYIQPTLFGNEVDVVYFGNQGKRGNVKTSLIVCSNMKKAMTELERIQPKSGDESTNYCSVSLFPKVGIVFHSLPT